MPLILVCSSCSRSEVPIRTLDLYFRGYKVGSVKTRKTLRRIGGGRVDLCQPCYNRLTGDSARDFKEVDKVVEAPAGVYVHSKAGYQRRKPPEAEITPK